MFGKMLTTAVKEQGIIVVNIACGMETRCYRMKGKYLCWYNVDLPETIEVHERFLTEDGPIYHVIGKIPAVRNISNRIVVMEKK